MLEAGEELPAGGAGMGEAWITGAGILMSERMDAASALGDFERQESHLRSSMGGYHSTSVSGMIGSQRILSAPRSVPVA